MKVSEKCKISQHYNNKGQISWYHKLDFFWSLEGFLSRNNAKVADFLEFYQLMKYLLYKVKQTLFWIEIIDFLDLPEGKVL